jgi:hypothetical protein
MNRLALVCAAAAACLPNPAMAAKIFNLQGVTLQGGGTLTGSFTTNDALTQLLSVNIISSANSAGIFGYSSVAYNNIANSSWTSLAMQGFQVSNALGTQQMRLNLALTGTGGTITPYSSYEYQVQAGMRSVLSGAVVLVTSPIPEPAAWAMMIAGFALVGATMRRRKATVAFS